MTNKTCQSCFYFSTDDNPKNFCINGVWHYGWLHRCEFDKTKEDGNRTACERYLNVTVEEARIRAKKYGFDKPVGSTEGATQGSLI